MGLSRLAVLQQGKADKAYAVQLDVAEGPAHAEQPPLLQDASFWWHALPVIATCVLLLLSLWLQRRHPTQARPALAPLSCCCLSAL